MVTILNAPAGAAGKARGSSWQEKLVSISVFLHQNICRTVADILIFMPMSFLSPVLCSVNKYIAIWRNSCSISFLATCLHFFIFSPWCFHFSVLDLMLWLTRIISLVHFEAGNHNDTHLMRQDSKIGECQLCVCVRAHIHTQLNFHPNLCNYEQSKY